MKPEMMTKPHACAFPSGPINGQGGDPGLTVREYFAAQALPGILAFHASKGSSYENTAKEAVTFADKLIVELNRDDEGFVPRQV